MVEESLFGKDPELTEDLSDPKTSIESISKQRQSDEICGQLKRSSAIYRQTLLSLTPKKIYYS